MRLLLVSALAAESVGVGVGEGDRVSADEPSAADEPRKVLPLLLPLSVQREGPSAARHNLRCALLRHSLHRLCVEQRQPSSTRRAAHCGRPFHAVLLQFAVARNKGEHQQAAAVTHQLLGHVERSKWQL